MLGTLGTLHSDEDDGNVRARSVFGGSRNGSRCQPAREGSWRLWCDVIHVSARLVLPWSLECTVVLHTAVLFAVILAGVHRIHSSSI